MLTIGVCDDNQIFVNDLCEKIKKLKLYDNNIIMKQFESGINICNFVRNNKIDIAFLDIEMPEMDGIITGKNLHRFDCDLLVIFISSHPERWRELFQVKPFAFIDKPIDINVLEYVLTNAIAEVEAKKMKSVFTFRKNHEQINVYLDEIMYFESRGREVIIHTVKEKIEFYGKLSEVEDSIKQNDFVRVHNSFLISFVHIKTISPTKVVMHDGLEINISRKVKNDVQEQYYTYLQKMK